MIGGQRLFVIVLLPMVDVKKQWEEMFEQPRARDERTSASHYDKFDRQTWRCRTLESRNQKTSRITSKIELKNTESRSSSLADKPDRGKIDPDSDASHAGANITSASPRTCGSPTFQKVFHHVETKRALTLLGRRNDQLGFCFWTAFRPLVLRWDATSWLINLVTTGLEYSFEILSLICLQTSIFRYFWLSSWGGKLGFRRRRSLEACGDELCHAIMYKESYDGRDGAPGKTSSYSAREVAQTDFDSIIYILTCGQTCKSLLRKEALALPLRQVGNIGVRTAPNGQLAKLALLELSSILQLSETQKGTHTNVSYQFQARNHRVS
ncbi:hypothetical protein C8J56DRAFT_887184 [Mycena floridula]|nr:hypothetical protein C8J56DRAFT_887184 [Mycena floridula]